MHSEWASVLLEEANDDEEKIENMPTNVLPHAYILSPEQTRYLLGRYIFYHVIHRLVNGVREENSDISDTKHDITLGQIILICSRFYSDIPVPTIGMSRLEKVAH